MSEVPFSEAIADGDKRTQLEAIRDRLAAEIEGDDCCDCGKPRRSFGGETAALALRLVKVLEALESIPESTVVSRVDELMARRTGGAPNAARRQGGRRRGTGA
ncbi:hypothetical protein [Streptomyces sp. NBC_00687]|uniref:hypothetical protein n=1 Tax=Streptomyces sp. NBC_00687 TaxID=2975807 RepID=UPI00224D4CE4|nr:hypothetical protein [Streptomyces sp. NBC_00687]MCX4912817.1 hypothetical protein [Streptomyces sp. NBC_00687]